MSEHDVLVVIPARLGSTRFPGKPLADVGGKPLLWHTWQAVRKWPRATEVLIATPDPEIIEVMNHLGACAQYTEPPIRNGSLRAFALYHARKRKPAALVNVQGDEPEVTHAMLGAVVEPVLSGYSQIATLAGPFPGGVPSPDPNEVKMVADSYGRAMYFSRQPLPGSRRHVGVYAFSSWGVNGCSGVPESACGRAEGLEQLDWLDRGYFIHVAMVEGSPISVNTPRDLEVFRERLEARSKR